MANSRALSELACVRKNNRALCVCNAWLVLSQTAVLDIALCWKSLVIFPSEVSGQLRLTVVQLVVSAWVSNHFFASWQVLQYDHPSKSEPCCCVAEPCLRHHGGIPLLSGQPVLLFLRCAMVAMFCCLCKSVLAFLRPAGEWIYSFNSIGLTIKLNSIGLKNEWESLVRELSSRFHKTHFYCSSVTVFPCKGGSVTHFSCSLYQAQLCPT